MKRKLSVLLLILLMVIMSGCGISGTTTVDNQDKINETALQTDVEKEEINTSLIPDDTNKNGDLKEEVQNTDEKKNGTSQDNGKSAKDVKSGKNSTGSSTSSTKQSNSQSSSSKDSTSTKQKDNDSKTSNEQEKSEEQKDSETITVTMSIDIKTAYQKGYIDYQWIVQPTKLELEKDSSAWDALNKMAKSKGIPVVKRGRKDNLYVSHINSLGEFDFEQGSGWMYNVNGRYPNYGCDNRKSVLKDGDVIQWRFTLNVGKDLGAPMS